MYVSLYQATLYKDMYRCLSPNCDDVFMISGNSESCRLLLRAGADINSVDKDGLTGKKQRQFQQLNPQQFGVPCLGHRQTVHTKGFYFIF